MIKQGLIFSVIYNTPFCYFIVRKKECFVINSGKGCLCDGCLWLIAEVFDKSQKRPKGSKFWGKNSAMCIPPLSPSPRCVYHSAESVSAMCTVHHSTKSDSAVGLPLRSQSPQCAFRFSLVAFKGTIRANPTRLSCKKRLEVKNVDILGTFFGFWSLCSNIPAKSKPNFKTLCPFYQPRWFESWNYEII